MTSTASGSVASMASSTVLKHRSGVVIPAAMASSREPANTSAVPTTSTSLT